MKRSLAEKLKEVLREDENILLAYLFGSQIEGVTWRESDVDVAVLLRDPSWRRLSDVTTTIASALGLSEDRVDVIDLSRADVVLKHDIVTRGEKLVDRQGYEEKLREEIFTRLSEALAILHFYISESGSPVRREVIATKLMAIDEESWILRQHVLAKPVEVVVRDPVLKRVLRDSLRVAIESALDVCKHVVASLKLGVVKELRDFPARLAEAGLLPKELAEKLVDYAKLRNIIVHRYVELDYCLLYKKATEFVEKVAPEFERFAKQLG